MFPPLNQNLEEEGAEDPGDRHEDCNERSDLDVGQHSARRQNVCFVFSFNEFPSFMWNLVGRRQTPALRVVMAAMLTWCDNYDDKDDEDGHEDYNNPNLGEGENDNDQLQKKWQTTRSQNRHDNDHEHCSPITGLAMVAMEKVTALSLLVSPDSLYMIP